MIGPLVWNSTFELWASIGVGFAYFTNPWPILMHLYWISGSGSKSCWWNYYKVFFPNVFFGAENISTTIDVVEYHRPTQNTDTRQFAKRKEYQPPPPRGRLLTWPSEEAMPVYKEAKLMVTINHQVNIAQSASGRWTLDKQIFAIINLINGVRASILISEHYIQPLWGWGW